MSTSKLLSRYIIKQFLLSFFAVMLTLGFITFLFDVIDLMKRESDSSFEFSKMLLMALLKMPNMMLTVLPFGVLIGAIIVFWRLTKSSELVIIRASGQSVWQFTTPLLISAFLIGTIAVTVFNPFAAAMYGRFQLMDDDRRGQPHISADSQELWLREHRDGKMYVLHADGLRQKEYELSLRGVTVFVLSEKNDFLQRIDARIALLDQDFFTLKDAQLFESGGLSTLPDDYKLPTELTLGKIQENFASPDTISFWDLPKLISFFESSGFSAHTHRLKFQSLLVMPFLLITMVLIATVFSVDPNQRRGGGALKVTAAIACGFLLYFMTKITYAMGFAASLPISFATWSPPAIFTLLSVSLLLHREDG